MKNPSSKALTLLLTPSWLSGFVAVVATLVVVVGTIIITRLQGSSLQKDFFVLDNANNVPSASETYQSLTSNLATNPIISNLPLFLFWAGLGLVVYFLATSIYSALTEVAEVREEMGYVNDPRHQLVREAIQQMVLRVVTFAVWIVYLQVFLRMILPYTMAAAHVAGTNLSSLNGVEYGAIAFVVMILSLHLHTVLLRLAFLRPRLFDSSTYA